MGERPAGPRVVVGVDGSPNSLAALRFAAVEARLRGAALLVVHAWSFSPSPPAFAPVPALGLTVSQQEDAAARLLDDAIEAALGDHPSVTVERALVNAPAADALREAAREADLLVVGARGHSGLLAAVLGSVAMSVVKHASCPVVVVPGSLASHVGRSHHHLSART